MDLRSGNCITLSGASFSPGIPMVSQVVGEALPIRREGTVRSSTVLWAKVQPPRSGVDAFIQPSSDVLKEYLLVYFEVPSLKFDGPALMERGVLWPGGEWHGKIPFWRRVVGNNDRNVQRRNVLRAEIWTMRLNEQLFVVDVSGRVRLLRFRLGQVELVPVELQFVVDYLSVRASMIGNVQGFEWVRHTLERLAESHPGLDVTRELAFVHRRLREAQKTRL